MRCGGSVILGVAICIGSFQVGTADDLALASTDFHSSPQQIATSPWGMTSAVSLPGSQALATGHEDGSIVLWTLSPSQPLRRISGHEGAVTALDVASNGRLLSTGEDGTLRIWNPEEGVCEQVLDGSATWNTCCAISQDGRWAASGGYDGQLSLWRLDQPESAAQLLEHDDACVLSVAFTDDGTLLATGDNAGIVRVWTMAEDGPSVTAAIVQSNQGRAQALRFLPDASRLVIGYETGIVAMRTLEESESGVTFGEERTLDCSASVTQLEVLAPDPIIAAGTLGGDICVWSFSDDSEERANRTVLSGHTSQITGMAIVGLESGSAFISVSEDRTIQMWRPKLPATPPIAEIEVPDSKLWAVAVSSAAGRFAVGGRGGYLAIHDLHTGACLHVVDGFEETVDSLNFSSDGALLAVSSWKAPIVGLIDVESGMLKETIEIDANGRQVHFTPDDGGVFVACDNLTVHRIDFDGTRQSASVSDLPTYAVDVAPDGELIAVGSGDWRREIPGTLKIFRSADLSDVATLTGHEHAVRWVTFHPDAPVLASSDESGLVLIWDLATRSILHRLINPDGCKPVRFSPDGELLAVGLKDGSIQVWDWRKDELLQRMVTEDDVFDLVFSPDGTAIIAVNGERGFFVWPLIGREGTGTAMDASTWNAGQESTE